MTRRPGSSSSARRWPGCGRPRSCALRASPGRSRWWARSPTPPTTGRRCPSRCWRGRGSAERIALAVARPGGLEGPRRRLAAGERATALDPAARQVTLAGGERIAYDGLVIATGAAPASCRAPALAGVHTCARSTTARRSGPGSTPAPGGSWWWAPGSSAPRWRPPAGPPATRSPCWRRCRSRWAGRSATRWARHGRPAPRPRRRRPPRRRRGRVRGLGRPGRAGPAGVRRRPWTPTWWWWASASSPNTGWLEGSGLALDDGVVCDATTWPPRHRGGRRRGPLAQPPLRRADAGRALGQRHHHGRARRPAAAGRPGRHRRRRRRAEPTTRCRGSGPTSTTARSSSPGGRRAPTRCGWSTVDPAERRFVALYRRGDRVTGRAGDEPAPAARDLPGLVERGATWDEALAAEGGGGVTGGRAGGRDRSAFVRVGRTDERQTPAGG